jgi:hypothetical protein
LSDWIAGNKYASVLPEPVVAAKARLFPESTSGIVAR